MLNSRRFEEEDLYRGRSVPHVMEVAGADEARSYTLIARRNNSLSTVGRNLVFGSFVLVSLAISLAFAVHGAWLVLPFSGLEMIVLYLAFQAIERRSGDFESIAISGDRVLIERWEAGQIARFEFQRYWAQVVFQPQDGAGLLAVRSHGRQVEFGRHLTAEQRRAVAESLRHQLRREA